MVVVPLNSVHGEIMVLVCLEVLARVGLGTEMNLALLSSDEEKMIGVLVEVEAHTTGKAVEEGLLLVVVELLLLIDDQFKFDDFLRLQLVFHEVPVGDATI